MVLLGLRPSEVESVACGLLRSLACQATWSGAGLWTFLQTAFERLPGCEPSQLWMVLQSDIECHLLAGANLAGLSTDLVRAFNNTPRQHSFALARHIGVPDTKLLTCMIGSVMLQLPVVAFQKVMHFGSLLWCSSTLRGTSTWRLSAHVSEPGLQKQKHVVSLISPLLWIWSGSLFCDIVTDIDWSSSRCLRRWGWTAEEWCPPSVSLRWPSWWKWCQPAQPPSWLLWSQSASVHALLRRSPHRICADRQNSCVHSCWRPFHHRLEWVRHQAYSSSLHAHGGSLSPGVSSKVARSFPVQETFDSAGVPPPAKTTVALKVSEAAAFWTAFSLCPWTARILKGQKANPLRVANCRPATHQNSNLQLMSCASRAMNSSTVGGGNLLMFVDAFVSPPAISKLEVCARDLGHFFFGFSILWWWAALLPPTFLVFRGTWPRLGFLDMLEWAVFSFVTLPWTCGISCHPWCSHCVPGTSSSTITTTTFATRIAPVSGRSGLRFVRALLVLLNHPVPVWSESLSVMQIPNMSKQKCIGLFGCSIKGFDVVLHQMTLSDLPKQDVSENQIIWGCFHTRNCCIPSVEKSFEVIYGVSSPDNSQQIINTIEAAGFLKRLEVIFKHQNSSKGPVFPWLEFPFWSFHLWSCESWLLSHLWQSELTLPTTWYPTWWISQVLEIVFPTQPLGFSCQRPHWAMTTPRQACLNKI